MPRKILVLGASGFIGQRLVSALQGSNWASPVAGVRGAPAGPLREVEHRIVEATDESAVARALSGMDAVVNCVAGKSSAISLGAQALFSAAARASMPRIVHMSTMSVYGDATGLVDETAPLRADQGDYAAAKISAENSAGGYPDCIVLRPGLVYGPASPQWSIRIADFLTAHRLGDLGVNGDGRCNLVHVDDVVAAIMLGLQRTDLESSIFNLSTPSPPSWNEYLTRYGRMLKATPIRRISQRRLKIETKLAAPPLKILELALKAAKLGKVPLPAAMPPSLARLMRQDITLDVSRAERDLGLRWKPLETGLEETARWYLARNRPG
jgi:nucleoside-diphosphate-sugar epimerase